MNRRDSGGGPHQGRANLGLQGQVKPATPVAQGFALSGAPSWGLLSDAKRLTRPLSGAPFLENYATSCLKRCWFAMGCNRLLGDLVWRFPEGAGERFHGHELRRPPSSGLSRARSRKELGGFAGSEALWLPASSSRWPPARPGGRRPRRGRPLGRGAPHGGGPPAALWGRAVRGSGGTPEPVAGAGVALKSMARHTEPVLTGRARELWRRWRRVGT